MESKKAAAALASTNENVFDEIMIEIGDSGPFQKKFNIIFNFAFIFCATMATFNTIISLSTPQHWCYVPGREDTNFTQEEWNEMFIPRINSTDGEDGGKNFQYSQCLVNWSNPNDNDDEAPTQECPFGWEYNNTYYGTTISSQENWVCEKEMYATNFLVFGKIGEIIGTTVFSQIGDIYGRRPVFYGSLTSLLIGKLGLLLCHGSYYLFILFIIIGNLSGLSAFSAPMVISMEISNDDDRTYIPLYQCVAWTIALCVAPLIFWVIGDWVQFTLITTLPLIPFLFLCKYMIESPRWLAGKGKMRSCAKQLKKIVKINKTDLTDKALISLNNETIVPEKNFGVMSLFVSWKMAKLSILVILGWVCYTIVYIIFFLNVSNLEGNPFLNFFWQGLAELPGYFIGKRLCEKMGRKFTRFFAFIGLTTLSLIVSCFITKPGYGMLISICGICLKCMCSIEFYAINLHTLEVYPTCLRQTGSAIGYLVASIFGIFAPYIIYLGTSVNKSYPYIFSTILTVIGAISGIFLPETLNEKLPETMKEAENFGRDQKLFSWPKPKPQPN